MNTLQTGLAEQGYEAEVAYDGSIGWRMFKSAKFDLVILDINLPQLNGYELCKLIREENSKVPVIMLTAFDTIEDKVEGYDAGADDYLVKPFQFKELLMKIRVQLKHRVQRNVPAGNVLKAADITLNTDTKEVKRGDTIISLTAKEFQLLEYLLRNKNRVVSRSDIALNVWDDDGFIHLVNVHNPLLSVTDNLFNYSSAITKKLVGKWISHYHSSSIQIRVEHKKAASIQEAIVIKAGEDQADLIVIGASNSLVPFYYNLHNRLTETSNCYVLKMQKKNTKATTLVVLFNQVVTKKTLERICMINKKQPVQVHLVHYAETDEANATTNSVGLLKAYQSITSYRCPVEYSIIQGGNVKKALKKYINGINNDVMLIDSN